MPEDHTCKRSDAESLWVGDKKGGGRIRGSREQTISIGERALGGREQICELRG